MSHRFRIDQAAADLRRIDRVRHTPAVVEIAFSLGAAARRIERFGFSKLGFSAKKTSTPEEMQVQILPAPQPFNLTCARRSRARRELQRGHFAVGEGDDANEADEGEAMIRAAIWGLMALGFMV